MSDDPIMRVPDAFGKAFRRLLVEQRASIETIAKSSGLPKERLMELELGKVEPSLMEFFWIARAFRTEPVYLFLELISAWRGDNLDPLYKTRPSDFARLYRLGYYHKVGDFREQERTYGSEAQALHTARKLNEQRQQRHVRLLDTLTTYVRLGSLRFQADPNEVTP
jgi:transcriptional regulator with XRE-family HTH domain